MKLDRLQNPALPVHDYRTALQGALSWLGDRYLLAQPINRAALQPRPNFAETSQWMPGSHY